MKIFKKTLKWTGITLLVMILCGVGYAFLGLDQTVKLQIQPVALTQVIDGTYPGAYNLYRWTTNVEVTVKDHQITAIDPKQVPTVIRQNVNVLVDRVIQEQTPVVDAIAGATASSHAFLKAVETALENGITK